MGEAGQEQAGTPAGALEEAPAAKAHRRRPRRCVRLLGAGSPAARRWQPEGARADRGTRRGAPRSRSISARAAECDFIGQQDGSLCLLPFPDDYYTVADPDHGTGRRVDLQYRGDAGEPAGTHIDAPPYDLNDGFSPGQSIVLKVPGLDSAEALAATGAVPINHLGRYREPDARWS